jgi:type VI secretion system secreted protein VgrG
LLHLISTEDAVKITAQRLEINIAGCQLVMENGHVTITMPGEFTVKTLQFTLGGPMRVSTTLPHLPNAPKSFHAQFQFKNDEGVPYARKPYVIWKDDGSVIKGITDRKGKTKTIYSRTAATYSCHIILEGVAM